MTTFKSVEEAEKKLKEIEPMVQKETFEYQEMRKKIEQDMQKIQVENVLPLAEKDARRANVVLEHARAFDYVLKNKQVEG